MPFPLETRNKRIDDKIQILKQLLRFLNIGGTFNDMSWNMRSQAPLYPWIVYSIAIIYIVTDSLGSNSGQLKP